MTFPRMFNRQSSTPSGDSAGNVDQLQSTFAASNAMVASDHVWRFARLQQQFDTYVKNAIAADLAHQQEVSTLNLQLARREKEHAMRSEKINAQYHKDVEELFKIIAHRNGGDVATLKAECEGYQDRIVELEAKLQVMHVTRQATIDETCARYKMEVDQKLEKSAQSQSKTLEDLHKQHSDAIEQLAKALARRKPPGTQDEIDVNKQDERLVREFTVRVNELEQEVLKLQECLLGKTKECMLLEAPLQERMTKFRDALREQFDKDVSDIKNDHATREEQATLSKQREIAQCQVSHHKEMMEKEKLLKTQKLKADKDISKLKRQIRDMQEQHTKEIQEKDKALGTRNFESEFRTLELDIQIRNMKAQHAKELQEKDEALATQKLKADGNIAKLQEQIREMQGKQSDRQITMVRLSSTSSPTPQDSELQSLQTRYTTLQSQYRTEQAGLEKDEAEIRKLRAEIAALDKEDADEFAIKESKAKMAKGTGAA